MKELVRAASNKDVPKALSIRLETACLNAGATKEASEKAALEIVRAVIYAKWLFDNRCTEGKLSKADVDQFRKIHKAAQTWSNSYQKLSDEGKRTMEIYKLGRRTIGSSGIGVSASDLDQFMVRFVRLLRGTVPGLSRDRGQGRSYALRSLAADVTEAWHNATGSYPTLTVSPETGAPKLDLFQCVPLIADALDGASAAFATKVTENTLLSAIADYKKQRQKEENIQAKRESE